MMKNIAILASAVVISSSVLAQAPAPAAAEAAKPAAKEAAKPAAAEAAKPAAAKPAARAAKSTMTGTKPRRDEDARHCLGRPSTTEIIKCAEAYL